MSFLKKLPGFVKSPPGLERQVLRCMPRVLLGGALALCLPSLVARLVAWTDAQAAIASYIDQIDMLALGMFLLHCNVVITVTIYAIIVRVMKGPAYVADAYPLPDADSPAGSPRSRI